MPLAVDPQFDAFERQLNQREADVSADGALKKSSIGRGLARKMPEFDMDLEAGIKGVGDDFLSRGVWSSGHRVQGENILTRRDMMRRANATAEATDASAGVDSDMARQIADLRRQRAEQALKSQQASTLGPMQQALQAMLGG